MYPSSPKTFPNSLRTSFGTGFRSSTLPGVSRILSNSPRSLMTRCNLKPKNQPVKVFPRPASPANTLCEAIRGLNQTAKEVESMNETPAQSPRQVCRKKAQNGIKAEGMKSTKRVEL